MASKPYPNKLKLTPGSDDHSRLVQAVLARANESYSYVSKKHTQWKEIDQTLNGFVREEDRKKLVAQNLTSPIIIPVSFATLQTLLTYMLQMLNQDPLFRYTGTGGDAGDELGAKFIEMLVHQQFKKMKMLLRLHTQVRDAYVYGIGGSTGLWYENRRTVKSKGGILSFGRVEEKVIYSGNRLYNFDPYLYLPDPGVSVENIQDSEHIGFIEQTNLSSLLTKQAAGLLFNVNLISENKSMYSKYNPRNSFDTGIRTQGATYSNSVDVIHKYIKIVPSSPKWKVGKGTAPEWWLFSVAGDRVLIDASPAEYDHGMVPITVAAPDYDGYEAIPTSRLAQIKDLQDNINWSFSSHLANTKKMLNDMIIYDPFMINSNDLKDPRPGKLIRTRKRAFGQDISKAIKQLDIKDFTQGHIADSGVMMDLMNKVSSASEAASGQFNKASDRVSSAEANNAMRASLGRLDKDALIFNAQMIDPLATMFASNVVQFMEEPAYVKATGDQLQILGELLGAELDPTTSIGINPSDIDVNYDIIVEDNYMQSFAGANEWISLFQVLTQNPEIAQQFDMFRIFTMIARKLGAKNINQFRKTGVDVMPDREIEQQVTKGNLVPLGEAL